MKLVFKRIKIKNFLSIGNLPVELEYKSGLNIVMGKNRDTMSNNGSGKSCCTISALTFALFGRVPSKIVKENLINSVNRTGAVVEVELKKNSDTYIIRQGLEPRFISIIKNGEEIPPESTLHLDQKRINDILEIDYRTFLHTIFTCVNYSRPFLELGKTEKRGVIEDILGISVFGKMFEAAHSRYTESKGEYEKLSGNIEHLSKMIKERKHHIESLKREEAVYNENRKVKIQKIKSEFVVLRKSIHKCEEIIKEKDTINGLKRDAQKQLNVADNKIKKLEKELTILETSIKRKRQNIKSLRSENKCDKCNTPITAQTVKEHIEKTNKEIKAQLEDKNGRTATSETHQNDREKASKKMKILDNKLATITKIKFQLKSDRSKLSDIRKRFNELKDEKFNIQGYVNLDEQKSDIETMNQLQKIFYINKNNFKYAEFSRKLLSEKGVKSYIIRQILPYLNKKANEYLKKMAVNLTIKFDEELNESIHFNYKSDFRYANFSGGEKKRIDLALMMTLLDISQAQSVVNCNLQILDEVIDTSLDSVGVELFQNILRERIEENPDKSIYIITHRSEINAESYDRIIKIVKEKGFTRIEKEV